MAGYACGGVEEVRVRSVRACTRNGNLPRIYSSRHHRGPVTGTPALVYVHMHVCALIIVVIVIVVVAAAATATLLFLDRRLLLLLLLLLLVLVLVLVSHWCHHR
eukprot:GHVU01064105.1.p2 GENE.GHVU01064105.1~~GHVU01064105.1.p2  ORF type:complete len:104 (-),score=8.78 GHVU01064105.1:606-917(-)